MAERNAQKRLLMNQRATEVHVSFQSANTECKQELVRYVPENTFIVWTEVRGRNTTIKKIYKD